MRYATPLQSSRPMTTFAALAFARAEGHLAKMGRVGEGDARIRLTPMWARFPSNGTRRESLTSQRGRLRRLPGVRAVSAIGIGLDPVDFDPLQIDFEVIDARARAR